MSANYSFSPGFASRLAELDVSLAISTHQSGILYLVGRGASGIHVGRVRLPSPTGLFVDPDGDLALASGAHIARLRKVMTPGDGREGDHDACYVPQSVVPAADLDIHDLAIDAEDRPIFVSTRCNCLATISLQRGFQLVWKPSFLTSWRSGDKCHVNGLAMVDDRPGFVTLWSRTDALDAWRSHYGEGGLLMDVRTDAVVLDGLSLPHSPRWRRGELWLLNSGTGELGLVEGPGTAAARFVPRAFCPGFPRGLALHGDYAFVGVSRPRVDRLERLPNADRFRNIDLEPGCSVQIIELATGRLVDWMRTEGEVAEIYDIAVLPGVACPTLELPRGV